MRKNNSIFAALLFIAAFVLGGCATWKTVPDEAKASNQFFDASLSTQYFQEFTLKILNKTSDNIEILWGKTLYIDPSGGTNECFTFAEELVYEQIDSVPKPSIVFPHDVLNRKIYPVAKRYWRSGWKRDYMPIGKNGVYLTTVVNGKEVTEKLVIEFVKAD